MQYLLLFQGNNGCMNMPQCYIACTWPVLFKYISLWELAFTFLKFKTWQLLAIFISDFKKKMQEILHSTKSMFFLILYRIKLLCICYFCVLIKSCIQPVTSLCKPTIYEDAKIPTATPVITYTLQTTCPMGIPTLHTKC